MQISTLSTFRKRNKNKNHRTLMGIAGHLLILFMYIYLASLNNVALFCLFSPYMVTARWISVSLSRASNSHIFVCRGWWGEGGGWTMILKKYNQEPIYIWTSSSDIHTFVVLCSCVLGGIKGRSFGNTHLCLKP